MAEPIVSFLVERIGTLLVEEAEFLAGVSEDAEQLHSEIKMMRAMLRDADEKQHEAAIVKEWVSQSKNLAYEAENVLETHAFKLASRQRGRNCRDIIRRYSCILNECYIRHKVGLEIRSLNTKVSNLTKRFQEYGIRAVIAEKEGSNSRQQQRRMTYSNVADDEDFVGFENEIQKLVQELVKKDEFSGQVVSLSGMGGLGKTTLARKVYNHPTVKSHFDSFAWVCISQQWQTRDILKGILVSFLPDKIKEIHKWIDDKMVGELLRIQKERKCLVVLDDIWSKDAWECIKVAFPIQKKGNKILLTTRKKDVAMHIGPNGFHHELKLLSDAESWELLQKKAFRGRPSQEEYGDIHNLEVLGREMVKFCGGLPLAVVVLGGILATKHSPNEWNVVHQNIKSYLGKGESIEQDQGEVQKILALSYNDLPYKLKPCFLYMSVFSEDEDIETQRLYPLWIAEGMVFAEDRIGEESIMDVAERYLGELEKRCVVHVKVNNENPSIRKFTSCRLHDLMRDLCLEKAREENFLQVIDYQKHGNDGGIELKNFIRPSSIGNFHRIMIYLSEEEDAQKNATALPKMEFAKHLRTLSICATKEGGKNLTAEVADSLLNRFKMLRCLKIEGMISPGIEDIIEKNSSIPTDIFKLPIGNLIHLRYLSLRKSKLVVSPSSISNLEHLETLDLCEAEILWAENVPLRMCRLRYLYLRFFQELEIYVSNNLEILESLGLNRRGEMVHHHVRDFSELTNIREIQVQIVDEESLEEIINHISNLHKLKEASLVIYPTNAQSLSTEMGSALLRQLFSSNSLQHLCVYGLLGKLTHDQYDANNLCKSLVELQLYRFTIAEDPMEILEKLPNLQKLWICYTDFPAKEMVCHSMGFPQLRFLQLQQVLNLEKWTVEKGAMPNLSRLEIIDCVDLTMIPHGLRFIKPLKQLVFEGMPEEFGNRIRVVDGRKGELFDEVCHIPSIMFNGSPILLSQFDSTN
ncbi:hypothetical protein ACH5RR_031551 [Cinchona calisaya]|uniref:Disease resistance protein At1g50180 n=1 Tax=Cinchona calisaya TaxID=153742 RepID=A0ABD2YJL8_9GENT